MVEMVLKELFSKLNEKNIAYSVLRGYIPITDISKSQDIDIFIPCDGLKRAIRIFKECGFKSPKINANRFPHCQFFKLTAEKLFKLDVVTDLCFGEELMGFSTAIDYDQLIELRDGIKVFRKDFAVQLFAFHIAYDKKSLSSTNAIRLRNMVLDRFETERILETLPTEIKNLCQYVLAPTCQDGEIKDEVDLILNRIRSNAVKKGILRPVRGRQRLRSKMEFAVKYRYRLHRLCRKSIAVIGVDGSGKSTTVKQLKELLQERCNVQYMGFREMETKWGREWYASGRRFSFRLIPFLGIYLEMWYRYLKNRFNNVGLIIFDRFPWEAYDNGFGKYKLVYFVLFKVFFPRPKRVYYLYCSEETSFLRKNDILDKELFRAMKKRFDSKYKDTVMSFDTDQLSGEDIVSKICDDLMRTNMYEFLF